MNSRTSPPACAIRPAAACASSRRAGLQVTVLIGSWGSQVIGTTASRKEDEIGRRAEVRVPGRCVPRRHEPRDRGRDLDATVRRRHDLRDGPAFVRPAADETAQRPRLIDDGTLRTGLEGEPRRRVSRPRRAPAPRWLRPRSLQAIGQGRERPAGPHRARWHAERGGLQILHEIENRQALDRPDLCGFAPAARKPPQADTLAVVS